MICRCGPGLFRTGTAAAGVLHRKVKGCRSGFVTQFRITACFQEACDSGTHRVRACAVQSGTPFLSWALMSAPASSRQWIVFTCLFASHAGPIYIAVGGVVQWAARR